VGTTARASKENVRSLGYSIYYTMVNLGGASGPLVASFAHRHLGPGRIFYVASFVVGLMFVGVLLFFREPKRADNASTPTVSETLKNFLTVLRNPKFMIFLLIFTGYWIVFWQQWIVLPVYLHTYVDKDIDVELVLVTDGIVVITCTILINHLLRKLAAFSAIVLGTLVSSLCWVVLVLRASMLGAVISIFILAIGEIIQQPRYYEYISRLAPPGQQGTYMGFAFLPLGLGSLIGGWFGGRALHYFGEVQGKPERVWYVIIAVGLLTTLLLWVYDRLVKPAKEVAAA
jgi:predicted MFS family arabinose efflux permease